MADMKADLDKHLGQLRRYQEDTQEAIRRRFADSADDLRQVAAALPVPSVADLTARAVVAEVRDFDWRNDSRMAYFCTQLSLSLGQSSLSQNGRAVDIPPGKYRALFFLVPLDGEQ